MYASGAGANVVDVDGNCFVDLRRASGRCSSGTGRLRSPLPSSRSIARLGLALGDVYASEAKVELCERLARLFPGRGARVLLGSSGADAVTAALKTVVLATGKPGVVAFEGAYHGLSHGPLAACGLRASFRDPFAAQLNPRVTFVPFPDAADGGALARVLPAVERRSRRAT